MGPSENWDVNTVQKYNVNCANAKASQTHCQNNRKDHVSPSCEAGASVCNRGLTDMRSLTKKKIIIAKTRAYVHCLSPQCQTREVLTASYELTCSSPPWPHDVSPVPLF